MQAQEELRAAEAALRAAEARLGAAGERARAARAELAVARATAVAQREEYSAVCGQVGIHIVGREKCLEMTRALCVCAHECARALLHVRQHDGRPQPILQTLGRKERSILYLMPRDAGAGQQAGAGGGPRISRGPRRPGRRCRSSPAASARGRCRCR